MISGESDRPTGRSLRAARLILASGVDHWGEGTLARTLDAELGLPELEVFFRRSFFGRIWWAFFQR